MDNNKIVNNLNFIKVYFRIFIYKIIVLEKTWIIQKRDEKSKAEDENASRYKDRLKNPRRGVQMAPKHESAFKAIRPIRHFWSVERHSKRAKFSLVGLWPNGLRLTIMHTLFDLFAKGCVQIQTLIVRTYFLESSSLYK